MHVTPPARNQQQRKQQQQNLKDFLFPKGFMSNLQTQNWRTEFGIGVVAWARG